MAHTNIGTCGVFCGFGANRMAYAVECQMDSLAATSGRSPVEMRRRNLRTPGHPGFPEQTTAPTEWLRATEQAAVDSPLPVANGSDVATAMALNWQGTGLGTLHYGRATGTLRLAA